MYLPHNATFLSLPLPLPNTRVIPLVHIDIFCRVCGKKNDGDPVEVRYSDEKCFKGCWP